MRRQHQSTHWHVHEQFSLPQGSAFWAWHYRQITPRVSKYPQTVNCWAPMEDFQQNIKNWWEIDEKFQRNTNTNGSRNQILVITFPVWDAPLAAEINIPPLWPTEETLIIHKRNTNKKPWSPCHHGSVTFSMGRADSWPPKCSLKNCSLCWWW